MKTLGVHEIAQGVYISEMRAKKETPAFRGWAEEEKPAKVVEMLKSDKKPQ